MNLIPKKSKVYIYQKPIDMRFGFERLSFFIREEMNKNIDFGDNFIFLGKNRKRLKAMWFDGSGLMLLTKRMENKNGFMNVLDLAGQETIKQSELDLLLHGWVLRKYLPQQRVQ